jgi:hypothetical protein
VKVPNSKGIANHAGLESCVRKRREAHHEALTGERVGQQLSRERKIWFGVPTLSSRRKATRVGALVRVSAWPRVVVEPGMHVRSLYGNREISRLTSRNPGLARVGKARSRSRR